VLCCAFAAFLFSQLIFALDWARERLGFAPPAADSVNAVVAWRLDAPAAAAPVVTPEYRLVRRFSLALAGGGAAFIVLLGLLAQPQAAGGLRALQQICTGHGAAFLASASRLSNPTIVTAVNGR
jgi:hypothetical protein